jgi:STAM-binding protein
MRYAVLISEKVNQHPGVRDPETRAALSTARKSLPDVVKRLELLKPRINARYANWQMTIERRKDATAASESGKSGSWSHLAASDPAVAGNITTLAADENSDLAVKLAHNEIRRRETKRRATRQVGVSEKEEQERRTAGLWDDWEAALSRNGQVRDDDEIQRNMIASRRKLDQPHETVPDGVLRRSVPSARPLRPPPGSSSNGYRYPSIPKSQPFQYDNRLESQLRSGSPTRSNLPPKPPKERLQDDVNGVSPIRPDKDTFAYDGPPSRPDKGISTPPEEMAHPNGQQTFTFKPSAYLENGNPLRTVFLPPTLRQNFLEVAASNTRNNLETCGMLCGTLISNALFISKLVIPEQESTSDTCETINESAFFDYCTSEDLMVLGWIHTHPSQTCFMSSRDLHTHCAYQMMMVESIAIVCAPSKNPS